MGLSRESTATFSWVLYDFASTIFSVSILSYFFPLWLADRPGAGPALFNYLVAASMLLVVLAAPFLGAMADLLQRRKPFFVPLTILSAGCTAALAVSGDVIWAVTLFVIANFAYQAAVIFYNSLLPIVSGENSSGRVSGYGGAAGYVGTIIALVAFTFLVTQPEAAKSLLGPMGGWIKTTGNTNYNAFVPTAALFLLFSIPAFLFVPDRRVREPEPVRLRAVYGSVFSTLRCLRRYAGLGVFILAALLYTDVANTVVANMSLYGREVFGMGQGEIRNLLLISTSFAAAGAVGLGHLADRIGPKRTLVATLISWLVGIGLAALAPAAWALFVAGPFLGVSFGATGVVSRVMLVALSPPEKLGEFFGFYSLAGKFAAVLGPGLTALLLNAFGGLGTLAYRLAVAALALLILLSLALLSRVPDRQPGEVVQAFSTHQRRRTHA